MLRMSRCERRGQTVASLVLAIVTTAAAAAGDGTGRELAVMLLTVPATPYHCFPVGSEVRVTLAQCCLQVPVSGYQAFIQYDPNILTFVSGEYVLPEPFGLPLMAILADNGLISAAAGINPFLGQQPTQQDADLVVLTFQVAASGATQLYFPSHTPPTSFSSAQGRIIPELVPTDVLHAHSGCPTQLGDLNCDGWVDFDDINPFVLALADPAGYWTAFPDCNWYNGDCNCDEVVDFDDINPFVACIAGACQCPE
jgi:hypothetical protein